MCVGVCCVILTVLCRAMLSSAVCVGGSGNDDASVYARICTRPEVLHAWHTCRVLVLEDVTLIPPAALVCLHHVLQLIKGNKDWFGGVSLVLGGSTAAPVPVTYQPAKIHPGTGTSIGDTAGGDPTLPTPGPGTGRYTDQWLQHALCTHLQLWRDAGIDRPLRLSTLRQDPHASGTVVLSIVDDSRPAAAATAASTITAGVPAGPSIYTPQHVELLTSLQYGARVPGRVLHDLNTCAVQYKPPPGSGVGDPATVTPIRLCTCSSV